MEGFKLSDNVLRRIVQIMQEGFLTGTDISDHMRMMRLEEDAQNPEYLILTDEYKSLVDKQHEHMLEEVEELKVAAAESKPTISVD
tara:strand:+ start:1584 stop:1841 length:258 start_codon:yes stop_codon:yes gene_type:complete